MIIAIDGYSSCGKSTLAKALAQELTYAYVDSGAMYRAVTYYFMKHDIGLKNEQEIANALSNITIDFKLIDGKNTCFLNGVDIETDIRSMRVSNNVSEVAAIETVRVKLVQFQRQIADKRSVVMDGRDIGTVVFPHADLKFFVTADKNIRTKRRYEELIGNGKDVTMREVEHNLDHRDHIDTTRKVSPLRKADDAIEIDNTYLDRDEQLELAMKYIQAFNKNKNK